MAPADYVIKNRLLAALAPEDLAPLLPHLQFVTLDQRKILFEVGARIDRVYFMEDGLASVLTTMSNGASVEVRMIGLEGVAGIDALLGEEISSQHVVMQLPGAALAASVGQCRTLFDNNRRFRALLLYFVSYLLSFSAQTAACNRLHSVQKRFARWLLLSNDRVQSSILPLTQEFLAAMIGARRASVTEAASELQRDGLISYRHGRVTIEDRSGLEAAACECYARDKEYFDRLYG